MKTKTQHTPGPWSCKITDGSRHNVYGSGVHIAVVPTEDEDDIANARLIAAAPELLAALRKMLDGTDDAIDAARAAIAKAEGE